MKHKSRAHSSHDGGQGQEHAHQSSHATTTPIRNAVSTRCCWLKVCRKTAIAARRIALQIIQTQIISAPDGLREPLRKMTRMQLIRTLAAWRPDLSGYRDLTTAYRIAFKSLAKAWGMKLPLNC